MRGSGWTSTRRRRAGWTQVLLLWIGWTAFGAACSSASTVAATDSPGSDPVPLAPAVEPEAAPMPSVAADRVEAWRLEIEAIRDLLIEDRYADGRERALRLLAEDDLPDHLAAQAEVLLEIARAKLEEVGENADAVAAGGSEPAPDRAAVPAAAEPDAPMTAPIASEQAEAAAPARSETAAPWQAEFRVRMGVVGRGFGAGDHGLLRVSEEGLEFTPWKPGGERWSLPWSRLASATEDEWLWDVRHPIVVQERGGRRRYLVRIGNSGDYLPASAILDAIREGRTRAGG